MTTAYRFTHATQDHGAPSVDQLRAKLEAVMRQPEPSIDWGSLSDLPVGSSFFVADSKHFGECIEVRVQSPQQGIKVFRAGKMVLI